MPGSPKRRARRMAQQAADLAAQTGESLTDAAVRVEHAAGTSMDGAGAAEQRGPTPVPGEVARQQLQDARDAIRQAAGEWLIGSPAEIIEAYDNREAIAAKYTPELVDRLLSFIRGGVPLKDTAFGPGAASLCGVNASTVWQWVHDKPDFAKAYREARDASSEVLEDEMRALMPTALRHPHLLESIEFISGRLEWLAKVRNRERYDSKKAESVQPVTINIGVRPPDARIERDITPKPDAIGQAQPRTITVQARGKAENSRPAIHPEDVPPSP